MQTESSKTLTLMKVSTVPVVDLVQQLTTQAAMMKLKKEIQSLEILTRWKVNPMNR